jgi:hypothetical protein
MDVVETRGPTRDGESWVGWVWRGDRASRAESASREAVAAVMRKCVRAMSQANRRKGK